MEINYFNAEDSRGPETFSGQNILPSSWHPKHEKIKGSIGPYAEINKVPATTPNGVLTGYAIQIEDPDAVGGWSLAAPHVSENYLLVPNQEVRQIAHEIVDESPWNFEEDTVAFDGKNFTLTLIAQDPEVQMAIDDFRGQGGHHFAPNPDDFMTFGLMFRNSYDAKQAFDFVLFIQRLLCSNGMVSTKHLARYRFTHHRSNDGWGNDVREATRVIQSGPDNLKKFLRGAATLASTQADQAFLNTFRRSAGRKLGVTQWGEIMDRWVQHEEPTAYGVLNASTNVLWHGKHLTTSDLKANDAVVSGLLDYALEHQN